MSMRCAKPAWRVMNRQVVDVLWLTGTEQGLQQQVTQYEGVEMSFEPMKAFLDPTVLEQGQHREILTGLYRVTASAHIVGRAARDLQLAKR